jgi:hypothetical protein
MTPGSTPGVFVSALRYGRGGGKGGSGGST